MTEKQGTYEDSKTAEVQTILDKNSIRCDVCRKKVNPSKIQWVYLKPKNCKEVEALPMFLCPKCKKFFESDLRQRISEGCDISEYHQPQK